MFGLYVASALLGLPLGALYALQGMGIVLVYRTTKVFSFAQAGLGVLAAFLTADCHENGLPMWLSAVTGISAAVVASIAIEITSVRFTRGAIQKTVVTLGWLLGLQGLSALLFGLKGTPAQVVSSSSDIGLFTVSQSGFFYQMSHLDLTIYVMTLGIGVGLALFLARTAIGTAMRGVSDDPEAARLLGLPVQRVAMLSWGIGGALAGLSGVLAAPQTGNLDQTSLLVFTVESIAVALVGRLESLPLTLAAGFGLGALEPVISLAFDVKGSSELTAFVVVLLSLVLRKRKGRADTGGGGLAPTTIRPLPQGRNAVLLAAGVVVAILVVPYLFHSDGVNNLVGIGVWSLATLSLVVLAGVVGQVSICTGAFLGIGAFTAAAATHYGVPFLLALVLGALVASASAALVALPAIRLEPLELAIATISLSFAADQFLFTNSFVVSDQNQRTIQLPHFLNSSPRPSGLGVAGDRHLVWLCFALVALAALAAANLRRGRTGASLTALRSSRAATAAMGFSVASAKLRGFATSGLIAGLAGGLLITHLTDLQGGSASLGLYDTTASITLLAYAVIGGLGNIPAVLIGGLLVQLPTILAGSNPDPDVTSATTLASGAFLVLVVIFLPEGIVDGVARLVRQLRTPTPPQLLPAEPELVGAR